MERCRALGFADFDPREFGARREGRSECRSHRLERRKGPFPSESKIVLIDCPETNVVDTEDGTLVFKTGSSEKVKAAYEELVKRKAREATEHAFEFRPWGDFEILRDTADFNRK